MPKVGNKEFAYTEEGINAAEDYAEEIGQESIPTYDAGGRVERIEGYGEDETSGERFPPIKIDPRPQEQEYKEGGSIKDKLSKFTKGWYPGKKIAERRAKRIKEGKWVVGEKLTKEGRDRASLRRHSSKKAQKKNVKKINKMALSSEKEAKGRGLKTVKIAKKADPAKLKPTGKIRKGAKSVTVTEGGAYAAYGKKSKAAKSFRGAFANARKSGAKTFVWDGRKYSTAVKKKAPAKKTVEKKAEPAKKPEPVKKVVKKKIQVKRKAPVKKKSPVMNEPKSTGSLAWDTARNIKDDEWGD